jgi:hypothetical protein
MQSGGVTGLGRCARLIFLALGAAGVCAPAAVADVKVVTPVDQATLQTTIDGAAAGDVITFPAGGGTISLTSPVNVPVGVDIEGCSDPTAAGPCVTLQVPGGFDAVDVTAGGAQLRGLAITGAAVGVHVTAGASTVIGGPSPSQVTTIAQSTGAAIEVDNPAAGVVVDHVSGLGNGGPFISLVAGANGGAQPPAIVSASTTAVVGLAPPGAVVRVYASPDPGSIAGFAGAATADATGVWELPDVAGAGEMLAATATGAPGTSQLSAPIAIAPGAASGPTTTIAGPGATVTTATPAFTLTSGDPSATLLCRIDAGTYSTCPSSYQAGTLSKGAHMFYARAAGAGGLGPEVSYAFTVDLGTPATIISGPPRFGRKSSAAFRFSVPSGTKTTRCALDGGRFRACSGRFSTGYLLDGRHVFSIRTTDSSGVSSTLDTVFTIDTLAPQVSLAGTSIRIAAGDTAVTITCPPSEPGGCSGTARLGTVPTKRSHAFREIGSAAWQGGPGTSETVAIPVPAWAVAGSQHGKGMAMNIVVVASDDAGNVREVRRKGRLLPSLPVAGGGGTGAAPAPGAVRARRARA